MNLNHRRSHRCCLIHFRDTSTYVCCWWICVCSIWIPFKQTFQKPIFGRQGGSSRDGKKHPFQSVGKQLTENKPRRYYYQRRKNSIIELFWPPMETHENKKGGRQLQDAGSWSSVITECTSHIWLMGCLTSLGTQFWSTETGTEEEPSGSVSGFVNCWSSAKRTLQSRCLL